MSELKVYVKPIKTNMFGKMIVGQSYYLKSEADKVIAELKAQKAQAEDDCAYWKMCHGNAANAMHETEEYAMQLYKELRHANYKRCLAMAKVCYLRFVRYENYLQKSCANNATISAYRFRRCMYDKWEKRWRELAEKFKEAE